jgi:hypothetical protein
VSVDGDGREKEINPAAPTNLLDSLLSEQF